MITGWQTADPSNWKQALDALAAYDRLVAEQREQIVVLRSERDTYKRIVERFGLSVASGS